MENPEKKSQPGQEAPGIAGSYWADKGEPKEKFDVIFGERKVEVKNFSDNPFTEARLIELRRVISDFCKIENGVVFDKIKSIFIDNVQPIDPETGEAINGTSVEKGDGTIKLYPNVLLEGRFHRVSGVSGFDGALLHEFTHALANSEIFDAWVRKFGWTFNSEKIQKVRDLGLLEALRTTPQKDWANLHPEIWKLVRYWEIDNSERCVTDYAKLGPEDDLAESMVAALRVPEVLDPERLKFLKEKFLGSAEKAEAPAVEIKRAT